MLIDSAEKGIDEDRQFSVITCKIITAYDCEEDGINYVGRQPVTSSEQQVT